MIVTHTHTQREAETQEEGEVGSMPGADVGLDPRTPGSRPGPKAGAKPLNHTGIPFAVFHLVFSIADLLQLMHSSLVF